MARRVTSPILVFLTTVVTTVGLTVGEAGTLRAKAASGDEPTEVQSATVARRACGWRLTGQLQAQSADGWTTMTDVTGKAGEWWIRAERMEIRNAVLPGVRISPGPSGCRLEGSEGIRILAPDRRYITGASLFASGSPAMTLAVWPNETGEQMASVIGEGWRMYGSAIVADTATDQIRVIRARSRSSQRSVSQKGAVSAR